MSAVTPCAAVRSLRLHTLGEQAQLEKRPRTGHFAALVLLLELELEYVRGVSAPPVVTLASASDGRC